MSSPYPYAGTYTVKLTVFSSGGSKSSSQQITIAQDNLGLLNNPIFIMLTGGINGPGYKTWVIDSTADGHMGVGPDPISPLGDIPEWWSAGGLDKSGAGLYGDKYVFHLNGFKFDMINNGDVYVHNSLSANFPGSFQNLGDFTEPRFQLGLLVDEGSFQGEVFVDVRHERHSDSTMVVNSRAKSGRTMQSSSIHVREAARMYRMARMNDESIDRENSKANVINHIQGQLPSPASLPIKPASGLKQRIWP